MDINSVPRILFRANHDLAAAVKPAAANLLRLCSRQSGNDAVVALEFQNFRFA
jgi:hypothetical protein